MDLLLPIAANVVLGIVLFALFFSKRTVDDARLTDGEEALGLFRRQFPDADGTATVTVDHRAALIALAYGAGIGLLDRRGRRWTMRELLPRDIRSVALAGSDTLTVTFADFGWPRAHFQIADRDACAAWFTRLKSFAARGVERRSAVSSHA